MMIEITFGEWLGDQLDAAGMEQQDLAAALGINPSTVSKWINTESRPHPNTCDRIAEVFGLDPNDVRQRAGRKPAPQVVEPVSVRAMAARIAGLEEMVAEILERERQRDRDRE